MNLLRQIALLFTVCVAGELISVLSGRLLPGNVLGMVLLLVLLLTSRLRPEAVENTADFLCTRKRIYVL